MTGLGSSCGACKFLRRKCTSECVFAPYFCYDHAANHFAAVHKVFGASNVSKLLLNLPENCRSHAAITISYEALARMRDPIYGCVAHIFALQQQVASLQGEIEALGNHMANLTVNMAGSGSSDRSTNPNVEAEISLLQESLYMQHYQNQSPAPLNQFNHIPGNHESNSQMSTQVTPQYRWEDQNNFCDSQSSALEQLLQENKDIFTCCSWLNSGNNIN